MRPPTVGDFAHQFAGSYLSVEGELGRTLKLLLTQPGGLTRAYLDGRRKHYVPPLRLYLSISLLVLLIIGAVVQARVSAMAPVTLDLANSHLVLVDVGLLRVGVKQGQFYCLGLPAALCRRLQQRNLTEPHALWQRATSAGQRAVGQIGTAMFVLVPLFALVLRVAYAGAAGPARLYAEHLVFALHLHAFAFLALVATLPDLSWLSALVALVVPGYALLAARRVYGGPWGTLLLRWAAVGGVYACLLVLALVVLALWSMAS